MAVDNGDNPLPPVPVDLMFNIPERYRVMIQFDSGPGDDRMILMGAMSCWMA